MNPEMQILKANRLAIALFVFGLIQIVGYISSSSALRGIGAASMLSPLPKVFSDVDGLETFASEFTLIFEGMDGSITEQVISPEIYSKLAGPYKRRNVYGAAISYAPRLPEVLWKPVLQFGISGPLLKELGFSSSQRSVRIRIRTKTVGRNDQWALEIL